jgi:hypothetical protein
MSVRRWLIPLLAILLGGCRSGLLVTIEADPELLSELSGFAVVVAGWNQVDDGMSTSRHECFSPDDLPLEVGIHAGDDYRDRAALRVVTWRSERLWFVHEELLTLSDGREDLTVTLSADCASCDGRFCTSRTGCQEISAIDLLDDDLDELASICDPTDR